MPSEKLLFDSADKFRVTHIEKQGDIAFIFVEGQLKGAFARVARHIVSASTVVMKERFEIYQHSETGYTFGLKSGSSTAITRNVKEKYSQRDLKGTFLPTSGHQTDYGKNY